MPTTLSNWTTWASLMILVASLLVIGACEEPCDICPIERGPNVLVGRVVSGSGRPIAGATVVTEQEPWYNNTGTDSNGRFLLDGLFNQTYTLIVSKGTDTTSVTVGINRDTSDVTILLPRWKLIWQDDFDGTAQNSEEWANDHGSSGVPGRDIFFDTTRISVGDGMMRLQIIHQPTPTPYHGTMNYRGAQMHTRRSWQHGRFEARVRLPRGRGIWPAVWLWPYGNFARPEFDIMENLGHDPTLIYMTYHYDSAGVVRSRQKPVRGVDFSKGFHEFAFEWFPAECRWYIDDVEQFRSPIIGEVRPMHLTLSTNVGGDWSGYPDSTTILPQYFDIDYVRVYEERE